MGNRFRQQDNLEEWRRRFQQTGCPVDDAPPDGDGGVIIEQAERNFLDCMATADKAARVIRYVFRLRLISDDPRRIIRDYFIESDFEDIRILEPHETVPQRFVTWGPKDDILNDRVNQAFGPALVREGMLLGEGLISRVISGRRTEVAPITVGVVDQFERSYSKRLYVNTDGLEELMIKLPEPPKVRGGGLFEPLDEDELQREERMQRQQPAVHEPAIGAHTRTASQPDKSRSGE